MRVLVYKSSLTKPNNATTYTKNTPCYSLTKQLHDTNKKQPSAFKLEQKLTLACKEASLASLQQVYCIRTVSPVPTIDKYKQIALEGVARVDGQFPKIDVLCCDLSHCYFCTDFAFD